MISGVKHIGLAVQSIDAYKALLDQLFGAEEIAERLGYEGTGQISGLIRMAGAYFELMEPVGDRGIVPKYLSKYGEGLHHLALRCGQVSEVLDLFAAEGMDTLGHPRGKPTIFSLPRETFGTLYEISQLPDQPQDDEPGHEIGLAPGAAVQRVEYFALAVADLDAVEARFAHIFDTEPEGARFEERDMLCRWLRMGKSRFKLMQPLNLPVGFRAGFRWIALGTDDLPALEARFAALGKRLVPERRSDGRRAAFTVPAETGGVLYELIEK